MLILVAICTVSQVSDAQGVKTNAPAAYDNIQKEQLMKKQMSPAISYGQFVSINDDELQTLQKMPVLTVKEETARFKQITSIY